MPSSSASPPVLARTVRDGLVESVHRGHVVLAAADGRVLAAVGDAERPTYVRSAVKPFQAATVTAILGEAGRRLAVESLAIASASHEGSADHQVEAAYLLALAGLDERALRCPPALPADLPTLLDQRSPDPLAHNCSGKHAGFLLAQVVLGDDPARYLDPASRLQRRVGERLRRLSGTEITGPGVDGCGAPAWVIPLRGLATAFARLAEGREGLSPVAQAMRSRPDLVGGKVAADTAIMQADPRLVAKRGAEGVLAVGLVVPAGPIGLAVKVEDGGARAAAPVVGSLLEHLGATVPPELAAPPVLGGGQVRGRLEVDGHTLSQLRRRSAQTWHL